MPTYAKRTHTMHAMQMRGLYTQHTLYTCYIQPLLHAQQKTFMRQISTLHLVHLLQVLQLLCMHPYLFHDFATCLLPLYLFIFIGTRHACFCCFCAWAPQMLHARSHVLSVCACICVDVCLSEHAWWQMDACVHYIAADAKLHAQACVCVYWCGLTKGLQQLFPTASSFSLNLGQH
jgi:hypothetical protein